jgi:NADPH:quinone reductase-like Zn-dependent oxidoreductase
MKAFIIDRYKPSDGGRIADVPEPVPADGQVLVRIHAAGVNLLDSKIRSGEFKLILPYRMPLILGNDVAGRLFAWDRGCGDSTSVTRCTPAPTRARSERSQS